MDNLLLEVFENQAAADAVDPQVSNPAPMAGAIENADFDGDLAEPRTEQEDVDYLLASANALFPSAKLTQEDVVGAWGGVRPLLAPPESRRPRPRRALDR